MDAVPHSTGLNSFTVVLRSVGVHTVFVLHACVRDAKSARDVRMPCKLVESKASRSGGYKERQKPTARAKLQYRLVPQQLRVVTEKVRQHGRRGPDCSDSW
jgi:hypothetical protein